MEAFDHFYHEITKVRKVESLKQMLLTPLSCFRTFDFSWSLSKSLTALSATMLPATPATSTYEKPMKPNTTKVYVCHHPKVGYLRFESYNNAIGSVIPDARGTYLTQHQAMKRKAKHFWHKNKQYPGSEIEIRTFLISWKQI